MKSDKPFLEHLAAGIAAREFYVAGGRDTFMREQMIRDAVIRNFEIIGEAAGRLSSATRGVDAVPWARIVAFRNRLIHGYWDVDPALVWDVIQHQLPVLKAAVAQLLGPVRWRRGLGGSAEEAGGEGGGMNERTPLRAFKDGILKPEKTEVITEFNTAA